MEKNPLKRWRDLRNKLVVTRVLEAGLEFKLGNLSRIVREMSYDVQKVKNPQDCPCYFSVPCHLGVPDFNCFLCACPNYDVDKRDGVGFVGGCKTGSVRGIEFPNSTPGKNGIGETVLDCSSCVAYHSPIIVERYLREHLREYQDLAEEVRKKE